MAYFSSREARDVDDHTLARHAQALTQIGEIRMDQARYAEAAAAFAEAYRRAGALAGRRPQDGEMLFARSQAEYWNGVVNWKRGELAAATDWLSRYHGTCLALVALDPARPAWRSELASGQQVLAVLHQERGEFAAARAGFLAQLETLEKMSAENPRDLDLRFRIANAHSWLGGVAEQQSDFAEALRRYVAQTRLLEQLVQTEPRTARWRYRLADALVLQSGIHLVTGKLAAASQGLKEARGMLTEFVALDPSNRDWALTAFSVGLKEAMIARRNGDSRAASRLVDDIKPQLQRLAAAEPSDRAFTLWLMIALRLDAQLRAAAGHPDAAAAAAQAVELGERLIREGRATDADAGECALARVVTGDVASGAGDTTAARRHWQQAADLLAPRLPGTRDWRLLDPAARAAARLGRSAEARAVILQLNLLGYVPLEPWPNTDPAGTAEEPAHQPDLK